MTRAEVRQGLVDALKLDLVGPEDGLGSRAEVLSHRERASRDGEQPPRLGGRLPRDGTARRSAMDRSVLNANDRADLMPARAFLLDREEDEETTGGRRRKQPRRFRWPDDFRDEVLARLLELNHQRAEQERLSGAAAEG